MPEEAKKKISGGRLNGMTDINPMWRIKMLTETFGACGFGWWYEITSQRIEDGSDNQKAAFVDIKLYVKQNEIVSQPIYGIGGSSFVTKETAKHYTSDECFKMALTDAIGNACKCLGIGADVYFEKDRTKYDLEQKDESKTKAQQFLAEKLIELENVDSFEKLLDIQTKYKELLAEKSFSELFYKKLQSIIKTTEKVLDFAKNEDELKVAFLSLHKGLQKHMAKYTEELKLKLTPKQ